ncbi:MAG: hypothetical protein IJ940_08670 [Bacteroidales bacterium]|nr:hypothetical protein [Bacteroidales bacterium]
MENILTFPAKLGSNNPKAYGIINAEEISGHKSVKTLEELFSLPDKILSASGDNSNGDAIGQEWWVVNKNTSYRLMHWHLRHSALGWSPSEVMYLGGTEIVISEEEPTTTTNVIWADDLENSIPEYENEDLQSILGAVRALQEVVGKHEFAF